jgi:hypothetical protein
MHCVNILYIIFYSHLFFQTSYNVTDIKIRSLEDTEGILNALEIEGKCYTDKHSRDSLYYTQPNRTDFRPYIQTYFHQFHEKS